MEFPVEDILLWCWLFSLNFINGARILAIFHMPARSHFSCNEAMMRSLYNAGHQITFVSPFPNDESMKNYSVIDSRQDTPLHIGVTTLKLFKKINTVQYLSVLINEGESKLCKDVLAKPEIQTFLHSKEKHFDVMFIELIFLHSCFLPLAEKLNIPVIGTVTVRSNRFADSKIGNPFHPALVPITYTSNSDRMTFMERLENLYKFLHFEYQYYFAIPRTLDEIYKQFYTPDLVNKKQISLVFVNHHSLLPRPTVPNVIEVGGIHVQPAKPLPQGLQKFIDKAEHGVILFSFGSTMKGSSMDSEMRNAFRGAFAQIPQRVIWKFEEEIEDLPDNVMLTKWMPQRDILAHKNMRAFMSHCGMSGIYEALTEGVPMILTPLFADQFSNAALLERLGVGILLDPYSATTEKVLEALNSIINDTRYRDTMKKLSDIFNDRPMSPQESIVYWTEYVIRHNGTPYMRTAGADVPLYQYLKLDIIAAAIVTIVFGFYIVIKIIRKLITRIKLYFQVHVTFTMGMIIVLKSWIPLWCWLISLTSTDGARILAIFPIPAKSHFSCNEATMRSLYNAGHQITFVGSFPDDESMKNYSVIDTRQDTPIYIGQTSLKQSEKMNTFEHLSSLNELESKLCKDVLSNPQIQTFMHTEEKLFDVMFTELLLLYPCFLPLAEKLNIPVIGTVTLKSAKTADAEIGNPYNPALVPITGTSNSDRMTFMERLENLYHSLYFEYQYYFAIPRALDEIYNQFYTPDLINKKQISLVFTNNHLSLLSRPTVPNVIDVGGIHIQPAKPLPQKYQKFIDEAEHGVILFSFGSRAKSSSINPEIRNAFRDAFAEIPQRVIWKFEEQMENLTENVMLSKWMPQRDILAHKNLKVFISHCGLAGSYEGLAEGVPMIFTPLFLDQMSNAALLERLGVGIQLNPYTATKEKVLEALNSIINDTRYRDTMKKVSKTFNDRPMSPQESIVFWTEYVIRHNGAPNMKTAGDNKPLYQYFLLDIVAAAIITFAFSSYIATTIFKELYHFFSKNSKF